MSYCCNSTCLAFCVTTNTPDVARPESVDNSEYNKLSPGKPGLLPYHAAPLNGELWLSVAGFILRQIGRCGLILVWIVWPGKTLHPLAYCRRLAILIVAALCFLMLQISNVTGLVIDEIFFRAYRKKKIVKPVFILGAPRSGTTTAHRVLAKHNCFATTTIIDCLLTPNICQRRLLCLLARIDSKLGAPITRLITTIQDRISNRISANHPFSLNEPEEDFLFLAPLLQCFLFVLPFPRSTWLWNLAKADRHPNTGSTRLTLYWYRMCIQKHMYCNPRARRYLAKNPTFSGMAQQLRRTFPDCQIIICERDAPTAVKSQFRVLAPIRKILTGGELDAEFDQQLIDTLLFYYTNLDLIKLELPPERVKALPLADVSTNPEATFRSLHNWVAHYTDDKPLAPYATAFALPEQTSAINQSDSYPVSQVVEDALTDFSPWRTTSELAI